MEAKDSLIEEVTFKDVLLVIWDSKSMIIALTFISAVISIFIALSSDPIFESSAVVEYNGESTSSTASSPGFLGGLSGIANDLINSKTYENDITFSQEEAIAFLQSREVIYEFFKNYKVAQTLYPEIWDEESQSWLEENIEVTEWKLYSTFLRDFFKIKIDQVSKLVYVTISFGDPFIAEKWCRGIITTVNYKGKDYFNAKMDSRIKLAQETLENSNNLALKDSTVNYITSLKNTQITENTKPNFLFSYIDEPVVAVQKARPNRTLMVIMGTFSGGVISLILAFGIGFFRNEHARDV
jgi:uncharacterized protein involved in exopolysaccharide biosynthesis